MVNVAIVIICILAIIIVIGFKVVKRVYYDRKLLANVVNLYANKHKLADSEASNVIQHYIYFNKVAVSTYTTVLKEGVFIGSAFVCSVLIPWENIRYIAINNRTKSFKLAELYLQNNGVSCNGLLVPWSNKYKELVPTTTGLNDTNA